MKNNKFRKTGAGDRHSKITGDFGEAIILYELSKKGFECANIDHTGIDILANMGKNRIGISVKTRGTKNGVTINLRKPDFTKTIKACKDFGCKPYFAFIHTENESKIRIILVPLSRVGVPKNKVRAWRMSENAIERYKEEKNITFIGLRYSEENDKYFRLNKI